MQAGAVNPATMPPSPGPSCTSSDFPSPPQGTPARCSTEQHVPPTLRRPVSGAIWLHAASEHTVLASKEQHQGRACKQPARRAEQWCCCRLPAAVQRMPATAPGCRPDAARRPAAQLHHSSSPEQSPRQAAEAACGQPDLLPGHIQPGAAVQQQRDAGGEGAAGPAGATRFVQTATAQTL